MNCNENHNQDSNNQQEGNKQHSGKKHMIIMLLCCLIPIVLLMTLPMLKIQNAALKTALSMSIFLLCPLLHLLMMGVFMKGFKKK